MKMIVGLGNPGKKYETTKHNIGFMTIDALLTQHGSPAAKKEMEAEVYAVMVNGEKVLFVKPLTFMNDSGRSVGPMMAYYNIELEDLIVIYDDMDLVAGKLRLRQKGSAGGHNGLKSLISHLGTEKFNRIRVGIERPFPNQTVINHVLSGFSKEAQPHIEEGIQEATKAVNFWLEGHTFMDTMNQYNHK